MGAILVSLPSLAEALLARDRRAQVVPGERPLSGQTAPRGNPALRPRRTFPACFFFLFVCLFFLYYGPHPWHMEVPRLGVKLELQLPVYTRATATPDPSRIFDLHHSSQQCRILNPLSMARDRTLNLMVSSQILFRCATTGTPSSFFNGSTTTYESSQAQ